MAWVDFKNDDVAVVDGQMQLATAGVWGELDLTRTLASTTGYRGGRSVDTTGTLVLGDAGGVILLDGELTVPLAASVAFPLWTRVDVIATGAGATIVGAEGVTVTPTTGFDAEIAADGAMVTLVKVATNSWRLVGSLAASA
jgi:hypothetical protein